MTYQKETNLPDISSAYQAPNRQHNLRTYFTPEGIRVIPRNSEKPDWNWGLTLKGYGFKGNVQPVKSGKLSANGNRVEYQRENLTEWYVNDEKGLEQGFTLKSAPESRKTEKDSSGCLRMSLRGAKRGSNLIVFEMELYGNTIATFNNSDKAVEFVTKGGVGVIHYAELLVFDANKKELPAKFALSDKKLSILVDASNAIYPITIDPLCHISFLDSRE